MSKKKDTREVAQLKKEAEEWKSKYIRALADYQNLERRIKEQRSQEAQFAAKNIILKILPIIDVLEKAQKVLNDQGIKLVLEQFRDVLTSEKIERIKAVGKKFNPHTMECVALVKSERENEVLEEVRAGYTMFGKVIRAVRVKVGKKR